MLPQNVYSKLGDFMRITLSTVFQVLSLIAQDVLAFEAQQTADSKVPPTSTSQSPATGNQTPVQ